MNITFLKNKGIVKKKVLHPQHFSQHFHNKFYVVNCYFNLNLPMMKHFYCPPTRNNILLTIYKENVVKFLLLHLPSSSSSSYFLFFFVFFVCNIFCLTCLYNNNTINCHNIFIIVKVLISYMSK